MPYLGSRFQTPPGLDSTLDFTILEDIPLPALWSNILGPDEFEEWMEVSLQREAAAFGEGSVS
jgi:hypothetical protein